MRHQAVRALRVLTAFLAILGFSNAARAADTVVQFNLDGQTADGPSSFQVELFDDAAPETVANFLKYVQNGGYNGTIVHRSVTGFVMEGGGFTPVMDGNGDIALDEIPAYDSVRNEYSSTRPNTRGTIAMAKLGGQPDSASNQWFINLTDNTTALGPDSADNPGSGGYTVFGVVLGDGMNLIDQIASLGTADLSSRYGDGFSDVPLWDSGNFVVVDSVQTMQQAVVPEPGMIALLAAGGVALLVCRRRSKA